MTKTNGKTPIVLMALLLPCNVWSMDSYLSISLGTTHSNPDANLEIPDNIPVDFPLAVDRNQSNNSLGLTYGTAITDNLFVEIDYSDLGKILTFDGNTEQVDVSAEALSLQLRFKWPSRNKLTMSAHVGLSFWQVCIDQPVQSHLRITELNLLNNGLDPVAEKTSGSSLKLGLSAKYPIAERWVLGLNYDYYDKIGNPTGLVNFNELSIGNLTGALTILPTETSLDVLRISLDYLF